MQRTVVITGASDGVGAAAARALAAGGDRVVVVGRTPAKVERVASETGADGMVADFTRLSDVRRLAAELLERHERIDVLANNAGGIFDERRTTEDGHEVTFQVNHLAPFLLTALLTERLVASGASVINTSSAAHLRGRLDLADPELESGWSAWRSYSNSKLANVLFTRELHRRTSLDGVSAAAFHPGLVASAFGTSGSGVTGRFYRSPLGRRVMVTSEQGADTLVWLADATPPRDWASGQYYVRRKIAPTSRAARDEALAEGLWRASERMLGLA